MKKFYERRRLDETQALLNGPLLQLLVLVLVLVLWPGRLEVRPVLLRRTQHAGQNAGHVFVTRRSHRNHRPVLLPQRRLAVLTAERTFMSENYTLVFRRFDALPMPQPAEQRRVVAQDVEGPGYTVGHALASGGDGQWLTAYSLASTGESRVFGRFVYESK